MSHVILFWTEGIEFSRNHRSALFNAKQLKNTPDDTEFNQNYVRRKERKENFSVARWKRKQCWEGRESGDITSELNTEQAEIL
jgi:hypothetical protein